MIGHALFWLTVAGVGLYFHLGLFASPDWLAWTDNMSRRMSLFAAGAVLWLAVLPWDRLWLTIPGWLLAGALCVLAFVPAPLKKNLQEAGQTPPPRTKFTTNTQRNVRSGGFVDERHRAVLYIPAGQFTEEHNPALTDEVRKHVKAYAIAPDLYALPLDNLSMQIIDSAGLYSYAFSSENDAAVAMLANLLNALDRDDEDDGPVAAPASASPTAKGKQTKTGKGKNAGLFSEYGPPPAEEKQ